TIEWDVANYAAQTDSLQMQVKLHSSTGEIEMVYGARSTSGTAWGGTIGVEGVGGSSGVEEACDTACGLNDVPSGTLIHYTPSGMVTAPDLMVYYVDPLPGTVQPNQAFSLAWEVDNVGTNLSPATVVGLYAGLSPTVTTADTLLDQENVSSISGGSFGTG